MKPIIVSGDPVVISSATAILKAEGISAVLLDQHMSMVHAGIDAFPQRLMVENDLWSDARSILKAAGFGDLVWDG